MCGRADKKRRSAETYRFASASRAAEGDGAGAEAAEAAVWGGEKSVDAG